MTTEDGMTITTTPAASWQPRPGRWATLPDAGRRWHLAVYVVAVRGTVAEVETQGSRTVPPRRFPVPVSSLERWGDD